MTEGSQTGVLASKEVLGVNAHLCLGGKQTPRAAFGESGRPPGAVLGGSGGRLGSARLLPGRRSCVPGGTRRHSGGLELRTLGTSPPPPPSFPSGLVA